MNESLLDNLTAVCLLVDFKTAMQNTVAAHPMEDPRTVIREACMSAAQSLTEREENEPEIWDQVDWWLEVERLAKEIEGGES